MSSNQAGSSDHPIALECGWWMPSSERHMNAWMRSINDYDPVGKRFRYQGRKIDACMEACHLLGKGFDVALDIGAHIGTWSYYLAQRFNRVFAWEPIAIHRTCFKKNVTRPNVTLYSKALAEQSGHLVLSKDQNSSGDTKVIAGGSSSVGPNDEKVEADQLDSYISNINGGTVDFIKVDCEGYEYFVLRGGENLLLANKPVVLVEQKPKKGSFYGIGDQSAVLYLKGLGAKLIKEMGGDFLMAW